MALTPAPPARLLRPPQAWASPEEGCREAPTGQGKQEVGGGLGAGTVALGLSPPCPPGRLQCYSCQSLYRGEGCDQTQDCFLSQTFCKTLTAQGDTGERPPWRPEGTQPLRGLVPAPACPV